MYGLDPKPFAKIFDKISYGLNEYDAFNDFLDITIYAFSQQQYETEYLQVVSRYKKETFSLFPELLAQLIMSMESGGDTTGLEESQLYKVGANDILGHFYMERFSNSRKGQFFTPPHVSDMMALMTLGDNPEELKGKNILDPTCGSGQMLLSGKKVNPEMRFYGADLDPICCKMAAINLFLNGMTGEIANMNSLSMEFYQSYKIYGFPRLRIDINTNPKLSSLMPQIKQLHQESPEKKQEIELKQEQVILDFEQQIESNKNDKPIRAETKKVLTKIIENQQLSLF